MGFNAPRIIGGGQIQQPQQVDAMGDIADSTWKAAEMKQTQEDMGVTPESMGQE